MDPIAIVIGFVADALSWGLSKTGLAGLVSVGAVLSGTTYLWWGYKIKRIANVATTVVSTVLKHGLVSAGLSVVALAVLLWTGVVPGVNLDVAWSLLESGWNVVRSLVPLSTGVSGWQ